MSNPSIDIDRQITFLNTAGVKAALARNGFLGSHITFATSLGKESSGRYMFECECRVTSAWNKQYQLVFVTYDEDKGIIASYDADVLGNFC